MALSEHLDHAVLCGGPCANPAKFGTPTHNEPSELRPAPMRRCDDLNEIRRPLLWTQGGDKQRDEVRLVEAEFRTHSFTVTSGLERGDAVRNHVDAIAPIAPR
jgi:hypothetical protein